MEERLYYRMSYFKRGEDYIYRKLPIYCPITSIRGQALYWFNCAIEQLNKRDNIVFDKIDVTEYDYRCRIRRVGYVETNLRHIEGRYVKEANHYLLELECYSFNPNE